MCFFFIYGDWTVKIVILRLTAIPEFFLALGLSIPNLICKDENRHYSKAYKNHNPNDCIGSSYFFNWFFKRDTLRTSLNSAIPSFGWFWHTFILYNQKLCDQQQYDIFFTVDKCLNDIVYTAHRSCHCKDGVDELLPQRWFRVTGGLVLPYLRVVLWRGDWKYHLLKNIIVIKTGNCILIRSVNRYRLVRLKKLYIRDWTAPNLFYNMKDLRHLPYFFWKRYPLMDCAVVGESFVLI